MTDTVQYGTYREGHEQGRREAYEELAPFLRPGLTEEQKAEALRIGRIEFKSVGATRKR